VPAPKIASGFQQNPTPSSPCASQFISSRRHDVQTDAIASRVKSHIVQATKSSLYKIVSPRLAVTSHGDVPLSHLPPLLVRRSPAHGTTARNGRFLTHFEVALQDSHSLHACRSNHRISRCSHMFALHKCVFNNYTTCIVGLCYCKCADTLRRRTHFARFTCLAVNSQR
jgi:hypothetical protein